MNKTETIEEYQIKYKKHPFSKNLNLKVLDFEQYVSIKPLFSKKETLTTLLFRTSC